MVGEPPIVTVDFMNANPILSAVRDNNCVLLGQRLAEGVSIESIELHDGKKWTALSYASYLGHIDIVKFLIDQGASVNFQPPNSLNPLQAAVVGLQDDVYDYLVQQGADTNCITTDGTSVNIVELAARFKNRYVLSKFSAAVLSEALVHAISKSRSVSTDAIRTLIDAGADVNTRSKDGSPPLYYAIVRGLNDCCDAILDARPDLKLTDSRGLAVLQIAVDAKRSDLISKFCSLGADVNAGANTTYTPLCIAAASNDDQCIRELIRNGADVNAPGKEGKRPAHVAAEMGHVQALMTLVRCGADIDAMSSSGDTPLSFAVAKGHHKAVEFILCLKPKINFLVNGKAPLHLAIINKDVPLTETLLDAGADPSFEDGGGMTPLMLAINHEVIGLLRVLEKAGGCLFPADIVPIEAYAGDMPTTVSMFGGADDILHERAKAVSEDIARFPKEMAEGIQSYSKRIASSVDVSRFIRRILNG